MWQCVVPLVVAEMRLFFAKQS